MVIGGLVLLARAGYWLPAMYVAGSIALIVVTPWPGQFSRYLVPLAPILALALVSVPAAVAGRARRSGSRGWRTAAMAGHALIAFVVVQEVYTVYKLFAKHHQPAVMTDAGGRIHHFRLFFYDQAWRLHDAGLDWIGRAAAPAGDHRHLYTAPGLSENREASGHASLRASIRRRRRRCWSASR